MAGRLNEINIGLRQSFEIAKALSTELRIGILEEITKKPSNVNEIAERFGLPPSTAAINIKKLEDAGLIATEMVPGTRGTQKICRVVHGKIIIDLSSEEPEKTENQIVQTMPIGHYSDCFVVPTCGLINEKDIIGQFDVPSSFYEPDRVTAQILWFKQGYVEYNFPNKIPYGCVPQTITVSMEICSEAPMYNLSWPSDITMWINDHEIGSWTSPGDFGGERGLLTPEWWGLENTQYGLWKSWRVSGEGAFIDGTKISSVSIKDVGLGNNPSIKVRIGVKPDAVNVGGINLFGRAAGNYRSDLLMRIDYDIAK